MKILVADFVLPISSEPISGGAVVIDGELIVDAGRLADLGAKFQDAKVEDLGAAAILPGFVNCHSHLEITAMRGALDSVEHDFGAWLIKLTKLRAEMTPEEVEEAAYSGALEGALAGVTCFGDIGRYGIAGMKALVRAGLRGIVFQETEFSPNSETAETDFRALIDKFEDISKYATPLVEPGLSPHAPYTVSRKLFEMIGVFARKEGVKLSIHAAESAEETEFMTNGAGSFAQIFERSGVAWSCPGMTSVRYLYETGVLDAAPLLAHCVTVDADEIELLRKTSTSVAHCPKSNAKFAHGYAPFEYFLDAGVMVGLGSDSVASNNACDMIDEARFAALAARNRLASKRFVTPREVLEAATLGGARALGLDHLVGTLEPGKQADIAVISLDHPGQQPVNDVEAALVFSSNARDVVRTMVAGKSIYSATR